MFNSCSKQKIIDYFERIYMWQKNEVNKVDYFLKTYDYPISLMSFNELFQSISSDNSFSTPEEIYQINHIEREIDNLSSDINLQKIEEIISPDLSLLLTQDKLIVSHFRFLHFENEWFCLITEKHNTQIYYISSSHKEDDIKTLLLISSFIQSLKEEFSSKSALIFSSE